MTPRQQGVFFGFAAAAATRMIAILLPPLPSNVLFPLWILYACALAWAIVRWSYRLASRAPLETGPPKHLQGVFVGILFLTGSIVISGFELRPRWVSALVGLGYLLAASLGIVYWNGQSRTEAPASK